jgi:hypothetical protein
MRGRNESVSAMFVSIFTGCARRTSGGLGIEDDVNHLATLVGAVFGQPDAVGDLSQGGQVGLDAGVRAPDVVEVFGVAQLARGGAAYAGRCRRGRRALLRAARAGRSRRSAARARGPARSGPAGSTAHAMPTRSGRPVRSQVGLHRDVHTHPPGPVGVPGAVARRGSAGRAPPGPALRPRRSGPRSWQEP